MVLEDGVFKVYGKGAKDITPEVDTNSPYYNEIKALAQAVLDDAPTPCHNTPEQTMDTIRLALAETESCDNNGAIVTL
jgi:predicted dehydrogenase